jgi:DNA-binding transcriptional MerR regulator
MTTMTIGQAAKAADVPVDTIRYYEKIGLLAPPRRSAGGYRHYDADIVARLDFITRAKTLGFTLAEIDELLSIKASDTANCGHLLRATEAKIAATRAMITDLNRMKRTLAGLAQACPGGDHPLARCPILGFLHQPGADARRRAPHSRRKP